MTQFKSYPLYEADKAKGTVVVVDVLRAFTTAAYAFYLGAEEIFPVSSLEEAFEIKKRTPGSIIMGEVDGYKPEAFDYNNSPFELVERGIVSKHLVQRTSAGTQGIIRTKSCETVLASSFVVAKATAVYLKSQNPSVVSFIITGKSKGRDGDEDQACAEYIQALFYNQHPNPVDYTTRIMTSSVGKSFLAGESGYLSLEDIVMSSKADIFDFAMLVVYTENRLLLLPHQI